MLGWDRRANRYDLHPIVRGVTWSGLGNQDKQGIYKTLSTHFESLPMIDRDHWQEVNSLEDLTAAIELYNTLIGLGRYDDAEKLFYDRLGNAMSYRLSASRQRAELLEMLFPDGLDQLPRLSTSSESIHTYSTLWHSASETNQGGLQSSFAVALKSTKKKDDQISVSICMSNLSDVSALLWSIARVGGCCTPGIAHARQLNDQA